MQTNLSEYSGCINTYSGDSIALVQEKKQLEEKRVSLIDQVRGRWTQTLEQSQSFWKHSPVYPIPYDTTAPIAFNPFLLQQRPLGHFLLRDKDPRSHVGLSVTREDIKAGKPTPNLLHEIPGSVLATDPENSKLVIIPNRFPKMPYHVMIISNPWRLQLLQLEDIEAQFRWVKLGFVSEFHRTNRFVNHIHLHLFPKEQVPISRFTSQFKADKSDDTLMDGELVGYPIRHIALISNDEKALQQATLLMANQLESHEIRFSQVVAQDTQSHRLIVLFFPYAKTGELFTFGSYMVGLIQSSNMSLKETEVMAAYHDGFEDNDGLNRIRGEFWSKWQQFPLENFQSTDS